MSQKATATLDTELPLRNKLSKQKTEGKIKKGSIKEQGIITATLVNPQRDFSYLSAKNN